MMVFILKRFVLKGHSGAAVMRYCLLVSSWARARSLLAMATYPVWSGKLNSISKSKPSNAKCSSPGSALKWSSNGLGLSPQLAV